MKTNKRNFLIAPGLATMAAALLSALSAAAEIVITAPKEGETVCQLFPAQLKFATESQAERDKYFDGAEHAKALTQRGQSEPNGDRTQRGQAPTQLNGDKPNGDRPQLNSTGTGPDLDAWRI